MAKLLIEEEWYEPVPPNALVDTHYEALLVERASVLFQGFKLVQVRCLVSNERGSSHPHLALVDPLYRTWWLVLLHTGKPPTAEYCVSQVDVLRANQWDEEFVALLCGRDPALDPSRLVQLVRTTMPNVFVLMGHPPPPSHSHPNLKIGIAEIFRAGERHVFRINGESPDGPVDRIATVVRDSVMRTLFKLNLNSGAALSSPCDLEMNGVLTRWTTRTDAKATTWLVPPPNLSVPSGTEILAIIKTTDGRLRLVPHSS